MLSNRTSAWRFSLSIFIALDISFSGVSTKFNSTAIPMNSNTTNDVRQYKVSQYFSDRSFLTRDFIRLSLLFPLFYFVKTSFAV
jgi:hypothetical protein